MPNGVSVSISIGGTAASSDNISVCSHRACELLNQRFVVGFHQIISQEYIDDTLSVGLKYPEKLITELSAGIKKTDKEKFLSAVDRLLELLRKYVYKDVYTVLLQAVTQCLHTMNSISGSSSFFREGFADFGKSSIYTLNHARIWFSDLFDEYIAAYQGMKQHKSGRHSQLIEDIQEYIENSYGDSGLSIQTLADYVGYTANYISKIYKNETGTCLRDYIKYVRITNTKELLSGTKLSIQEISVLTGFVNYNYFFSSFKKEIGLTPSIYRNSSASKE